MEGKETMKLKKLLALLGSGNVDYQDDAQRYIVIRPECEEWTWVRLNLNSGLLELLGDLDVESIDADDGDIAVWVRTESFNCFRAVGGIDEERGYTDATGTEGE